MTDVDEQSQPKKPKQSAASQALAQLIAKGAVALADTAKTYADAKRAHQSHVDIASMAVDAGAADELSYFTEETE